MDTVLEYLRFATTEIQSHHMFEFHISLARWSVISFSKDLTAESILFVHLGVSKNRGTPKWMVYNDLENPIKKDDLGVPLFSETSI